MVSDDSRGSWFAPNVETVRVLLLVTVMNCCAFWVPRIEPDISLKLARPTKKVML